jgi:hypothetical protein
MQRAPRWLRSFRSSCARGGASHWCLRSWWRDGVIKP